MAIDNETMETIERCVARALADATSLKGASAEIAKGVTQYVGARYVPLFAEPLEWDKTRAYEPLTIVLHQGNSFTSRQYVPTGVEIDNESFWANTGNYNAQVEQYRQEVKTYDGRITANADAIAKETEDRTAAVDAEKTRATAAEQTLQGNIDAEKSRAEGAEQTLQGNIDTLAKKPIMVVVGDSWNVNLGSGVWTDSVKEHNVINVAVAGSGLLNASPDGKSTFEQQLDKANEQVTDKTKVDTVYAVGFINDLASNVVPAAQLTTAIASFVNKAKEFFPNAKIVFVSNSYNTGATIQTFDGIKHICITANLNGAAFKDITGMLPIEYLDATQHPNSTGSKVLYNLICFDSYQGVLTQSSIFPTAFEAEKAHLSSIDSEDFSINVNGTRFVNKATVAFTPKTKIDAGTNKFKELIIDNKWLLLSLREGCSFVPLILESAESTPIGLIRKTDEINKMDMVFFKEAPANVKVIADITALL